MDNRARLLAAYDEQLRTDAETRGAIRVQRLGPLRLATFTEGEGFITYRSLGGADLDAAAVRDLVVQGLAHLSDDSTVTSIEWKSRGHDHAPGLHEALLDSGFLPDEQESIMIGDVGLLAVDVPLPEGVTIRQIRAEADVRAMAALQDEIFGEHVSDDSARDLLRRLELDEDMELWVAEADGHMICSGRLEPVPGTSFAGIWGGGTRPEWRHRGIYRALTAVRARSAQRKGKTLIHSDSTEFSRPILERAGLTKVSTTTPYRWQR